MKKISIVSLFIAPTLLVSNVLSLSSCKKQENEHYVQPLTLVGGNLSLSFVFTEAGQDDCKWSLIYNNTSIDYDSAVFWIEDDLDGKVRIKDGTIKRLGNIPVGEYDFTLYASYEKMTTNVSISLTIVELLELSDGEYTLKGKEDEIGMQKVKWNLSFGDKQLFFTDENVECQLIDSKYEKPFVSDDIYFSPQNGLIHWVKGI